MARSTTPQSTETPAGSESAPEAAPDTAADTAADTAVARIVAIDDDAAALKLVGAVLKRHDVIAYDNPRDALEALEGDAAPDLILCDVSMPGLDGFGLHEAVRGIAKLRGTPFIYMTALDGRDDVRRGMGLGADDYLTKPFTPEELREAVASRLGRTGTLREAAERDLTATSLGGLGLTAGGRRLQWEAKKAVELFLYLLAHGRRASFDSVRRDLWWKSSSDNHLHVLVSRLRKALQGVAAVESDDDDLVLVHDGSVTWDAAVFGEAAEAALASPGAAAIEGAIRLYRGPFLPGFDSPWSDAERVRLEELYIRLLEAAVDGAINEVARDRARARLERFLDLD